MNCVLMCVFIRASRDLVEIKETEESLEREDGTEHRWLHRNLNERILTIINMQSEVIK